MSHPRADDPWPRLLDELRDRGISVEPSLTDAEAKDIQFRFGFRFPPDLLALLQTGLPVGEGFPDWRNGDEDKLREHLDWPRDGIAFDVVHNVFWPDDWGPRPDSDDEAVRVANHFVAAAPRLVPVYLHRMIPTEPAKPGNPVFSVYQTDIIVYGNDLLSYFAHEFPGVATWHTPPLDARRIRFWSDVAG